MTFRSNHIKKASYSNSDICVFFGTNISTVIKTILIKKMFYRFFFFGAQISTVIKTILIKKMFYLAHAIYFPLKNIESRMKINNND